MTSARGQLVLRTDALDHHLDSCWTLHESAQSQVWQLATVVLYHTRPVYGHIGSLNDAHLLFDGLEDIDIETDPALFSFLTQILTSEDHEQPTRIGLIVPCVAGRIMRSDIVRIRLADLTLVETVTTLAVAGQVFKPISIESNGEIQAPQTLLQLLRASAAGFVLPPDTEIDDLQAELAQRLSMTWIKSLACNDHRRTLALVDGRHDPHVGESLYSAAQALCIDLIVVERPGHWITQDKYRSWYKDLLIIDMTIDDGFSDRIVDAIRNSGHAIDGIITMFDPRAVATARAAEKLGVSRAPVDAFEVATDKLRTSLLDSHSAHRVSTVEEARSIIQAGQASFPLILKPVAGFLSEGVFLVHGYDDLEHAISDIVGRRGKDALMEPYCDGPELDANFVLVDGEVVFFEASDDFPTTAEEGPDGSFIEQANVLPSGLPEQELQVVEKSLHQRLLQLGFADGIFHLEARVQNSSMYYTKTHGILDIDMIPKTSGLFQGTSAPSAWLIEINPRPPGIQSFQATALTYGVDYIGLSLLLAVGDRERARVLAQPFKQRHQYWSQILFIPTPKGGVFDSDDVCVELKERCPELSPHLSVSFCHWKRGDIIPDPLTTGQLTWVAYYVVHSRVSRRHLLEICDKVRNETRFSIV